MTEKSKSQHKRKPKYPFSKLRVYFNAIAGFVALLLCLTLLISYSELLVTLAFISLTAVIIVLSLRLKIVLLERMEESEIGIETGYVSVEESNRSSSLNWKLVAVVVLLALVLLLPVVSALFVDPLLWFVAFASFVVGFSLSEVFLYMYAEH